jgi:transglutaminase-like putative cysteine protease
MTRLLIDHRTGYDYLRRVSLSYNEARMTPLTDSQQVVLESTISLNPSSASMATYRDYWGTRVTSFDVQVPHDRLEVSARTLVEVSRTERIPSPEEVVGWEQLRSDDVLNDYADWLSDTHLTAPNEEIRELVKSVVGNQDPHSAAHGIFDWLKDEMQYVQGVTGVQSNARDAWGERQGVCQDLAHVAIGALRSLGIPAR